MTRRQVREYIFKTIFQVEFHDGDEMPEQMTNFLDLEEPEDSDDKQAIEAKCQAILDKLPEIDAIIDEAADGWKTTRMAKVDLSLLRLATYEIKFEGLAEGIAINEAVELAKKYGADSSPAFVNGVLAKVV